MTTEFSKCAWCGKEPIIVGNFYVYCNNRRCVQFDYADNGIEFWNQHQENFLAQRLQDFEAGRMVDVNPLNGQSMSTFEDYMEARHGEEEK